jgi:hypothetical protein
MIAVMMTTLILFFAFVINTGMLVNAKINLQNAADMAAFAGASVQARQLTYISYLNYEMRRQWKKFLYRLFVFGNMAQDSFPRQLTGPATQTTPMQYTQVDINTGAVTNYFVPVTCVVFSERDNYCRLKQLPKISIPPAAPLDGVNDALRAQLIQIEQIRENNCQGIAFTNKILNYYWLYNADPTLQAATAAINGTPGIAQNVATILLGLITGIGIVPRELILNFRIKTLASYVNDPANLALTYDKVQGLINSADPVSHERSIQAFLSAFYTLGNHTFPSGSVQMDELQNDLQLTLKPITATFDTWAIDQQLDTTPDADGSKGCSAVLVPISVKQPMTLGFYKDPSHLTYYAVRLKASARILFSPFGDLTLKAYAAAQPFGSRIGPSGPSFTLNGRPPDTNGLAAQNSVGKIPNLPLRETDSASQGSGWDTEQTLGSMYSLLTNTAAPPGTLGVISSDMVKDAYLSAMAPNPWEKSQYNIMNDMGEDSFIKNFGTDEIAAIWAPIFPQAQLATASQEIQQAVQALFVDSTSLDNGKGNVFQALQQSITQALDTYISSALATPGGGENGESRSIATLTNPFKVPSPGGGPSATVRGNPALIMNGADPSMFKTSWNGVNSSDFQIQGRVGYSVKFVSFDTLSNHSVSSNGQDFPSNNLAGDEEARTDMPNIKH